MLLELFVVEHDFITVKLWVAEVINFEILSMMGIFCCMLKELYLVVHISVCLEWLSIVLHYLFHLGKNGSEMR